MIEFAYSLKNDPKKAFDEIRSKAENLDFRPNLAIVYLTEHLQKDAKVFKFDFETLCVPVEGFITPDGVWTRGCLCMFADIDYTLNVFRGNPDEVVEQLRSAEKGRFNLLVYPLFYVESKVSLISNFLKLKLAKNAKEASKVFENAIYPMNKLLRPFRDEKSITASLNLYPVKFSTGRPQIFLNGSKTGRCVVHLALEDKFESQYSDFLPERGRSVEETKKILENDFQFIDEVTVKKDLLVIEEINGLKIRDFLRMHKVRMKEDLEKDLEEGEFFGATPYGLLFFSKETGGIAGLGLMDYDLRFYPSFFELTPFDDSAIFFGERLKDGLKRVRSELKEKRSNFVLLDQNIMLMFEEKLVEVFKDMGIFGIITSFPSYSGKPIKKLMTEVEDRIFMNTTLSSIFIRLTN
ncbi:MAG: hypothetical protein XD40_0900 [Archaeoglobus fulgidus]|uniref:FIST domain-containing protein n=2 Tax=Archaeoglobus fulgidus TaxID=2234 RepID=A0A124F885_ARCFL|nr:hypothetical protein [Archaeoglobus fulgidus]KUJ93866.1 MAG: hypothetical protein XD40_0900 [Archaeoglobus fulgidus]